MTTEKAKILGVKWLVTIAAIFVFTFTLNIAYQFFAQSEYNKPTTYLGMELLTPQPVRPGQRIVFRSHREKRRICSVITDRFITHVDGNTVRRAVYSDTTPGGFSPIGIGFVDVEIKLPEVMTDGIYAFSQVIRTNCGEGFTFIDTTQPVIFEVKND